MKESVADLLPDLFVGSADGFDALLKNINSVGKRGIENAPLRQRNPVVEAEEHAVCLVILGRLVFNDDCDVDEPAPKGFRQTFKGLVDERLKSSAVHSQSGFERKIIIEFPFSGRSAAKGFSETVRGRTRQGCFRRLCYNEWFQWHQIFHIIFGKEQEYLWERLK